MISSKGYNWRIFINNYICVFSDASATELREMAASEIRRAIMGRIPECLRNCVNKEYFMGPGSYPEGTGNNK